MKIESRFLILTASILLGCFVGLAYFNLGDFYSTSARLDENGNPYDSEFDRMNSSGKSLKEEIHQQLASTRTLYEFASSSEQKNAETPAQTETPDLLGQLAAEAGEPAQPTELATVEVDPEKMGDVLAEMAQNSPELTDSLNALNEARKAPAEKLALKTGEPQESLEPAPKALICVKDYTPPATPILNINPAEDLVEFQVQGAAEAQRSLSQELLAQTQPPAPDQTPSLMQVPAHLPSPAQLQIPAQVQGFAPIEPSVLAQGTTPIQTSVQIVPSTPIQTTTPFETPELVQTSALVQASAPFESSNQASLLPASGVDFEQASIHQSVGSLAALPDQTPASAPAPVSDPRPISAPAPLPVAEIQEDLDQNPLSTIMGLTTPENPGENKTGNAPENPGDAAGVSAETSAEADASGGTFPGASAETAAKTPEGPLAGTSAASPMGSPAVSTPETPVASPAASSAANSAGAPAVSSTENPAGSPVASSAANPAGSPAVSSTENPAGSPVVSSAANPAGAPAVSSTETPAGSPVASSAEAPVGSPVGTSVEIPKEFVGKTTSETPKQIAESSISHLPTRIKKPERNQTEDQTGKETRAPIQKEEYSLDFYRVNLRKALASFQIETGLKVVASLDVQGTVSCKSKNSDPEVLLESLLADTKFKFVRNGNFVYIAPSNQLTNLPNPIEKTETQFFTPKHISLEELELVLRSNLSQFGTCEISRDPSGQKGLSVTDWVLSLNQLEKIQQIVDVPAPEEQMNALIFQHELDGTFKALELWELAESQGLVLQRIALKGTENKEEKKSFFPSVKKEKTSEIQAYTISYRADSFVASVRQQLKTQPAQITGQTSVSLKLGQPMTFDFNLNVQDRLVPYQITVTYRQDPAKEDELNAEVVCAPRENLGPKSKANDFHFTLTIPSQSRNSLILQLDLGEFQVENAGSRKDIAYAMRGNRMKKEVVVALCPFQNIPKITQNGLSTQAVREIIRQQETLARKFYGSMDESERENSKHCFGIAQRLRLSLGEMRNQSFESEFEQDF